jgi:hypothetical protein
MQPLLGAMVVQAVLSLGGIVLLLSGVWLAWWFGSRRRAYERGRYLLHQGAWREALALTEDQGRRGRLSPVWQGRFRDLTGECHRHAGHALLGQSQYEQALEHFRLSAELLSGSAQEGQAAVVEAMLAEVRRLYALESETASETAQTLIGRILAVQPRCAEASFWQGLCGLRQERFHQAQEHLLAAHESGASCFDPAFYLGALLLRQGSAAAGLRYLSEANRQAPDCPWVAWQLGLAVQAAEGDGQLVVRALQRALDRLLALRGSQPLSAAGGQMPGQRLWLAGLAESGSYILRLAAEYPFRCPIVGDNLEVMIQQVRLALGQALYQIGNYQAVVDLYQAMLRESPPTLPVLRGLGQALARQGQYEDAYNPLRAAYDQEEPRNLYTCCYLALCAARGRPRQPEDRARNLEWALTLLHQVNVSGNAECAELCTAVHAEARSLNTDIPAEDQVRLCDALVSIEATNVAAASAYAHLASTFPDRLRPEYAWFYCRAAQEHAHKSPLDLDLFAYTFRDAASARAFYAQRHWDFDEVEFTYLKRAADLEPGRFPEVLGPAYAARGERLLLERSHRHEQAGDETAALASAEILLRLAPGSLAAHDRLAALCYRRGDWARAAELLADWHVLDPANPLPLLRQAIIEQRRGNGEGFADSMDRAFERTQNGERAAAAFLGARLTLVHSPARALNWLSECLREDPDHKDALWCLAAVRAAAGDREGLAAQATLMHRPEIADSRFQYLAACCHLAAGDRPQVVEASSRAAELDPAMTADAAYLQGLAHWRGDDPSTATATLERVAQAASPSRQQALALLGSISLVQRRSEDAIRWWKTLDSDKRTAWKLDEPLANTALLAGLEALVSGQFERAAGRFREGLALVREGERLLPKQSGESARVLEQALSAGCRDRDVVGLLASAYQNQGKLREAHATWGRIPQPDAAILAQMGNLSLAQNQLVQAEQEFAAAWAMDRGCFAICYNLLLTRLTLGQLDASAALLPEVTELAPDAVDRRCLSLLQALVQSCQVPNDPGVNAVLAAMDAAEEEQLLSLVRSLGHMDTVVTLIQALAVARPTSPAAHAARIEALMIKAKRLLDQCDPGGAERILLSLEMSLAEVPASTRAALLNLLGCCGCLGQDPDRGVHYFEAALAIGGEDFRIEQNLALAHEWRDQPLVAVPHWERYLKLLDSNIPGPRGRPDYGKRLAFEANARLAAAHADKESWSVALSFAERALALQPNDAETLEKLFHLYTQAGRPGDARRILRLLRQARPQEAHLDLYELDLLDVRSLDGIDEMIGNIERVLKRHPQDNRVELRALVIVGNLIPMLERLYNQSSNRLAKVLNQVRQLPNYQIDWSVLRDVLRDLRGDFQRLRRAAARCFPLVRDDEQRRVIRELTDRIDRKIEQCRARGG